MAFPSSSQKISKVRVSDLVYFLCKIATELTFWEFLPVCSLTFRTATNSLVLVCVLARMHKRTHDIVFLYTIFYLRTFIHNITHTYILTRIFAFVSWRAPYLHAYIYTHIHTYTSTCIHISYVHIPCMMCTYTRIFGSPMESPTCCCYFKVESKLWSIDCTHEHQLMTKYSYVYIHTYKQT